MADVPEAPRDGQPEVVRGIDALAPRHGRLFVVVGVFDGLHLGHAYLLRHLRQEASSRQARPTVITFDHHPDEVLKGVAPALLCDPEARLRLLGEAGVELTVVQHFDRDLRLTPFEVFVGRIAERVDLAGFLMTPDAAFGHDRGGTPSAVAELGAEMGYEVVVIPPMELSGRPVRSTEIREAIKRGDLVHAAALLGRPYAVRGVLGPIVQGSRALRFAMPVALPPAGQYPAAVSVGALTTTLTATVGSGGAVVVDRTLGVDATGSVADITFLDPADGDVPSTTFR